MDDRTQPGPAAGTLIETRIDSALSVREGRLYIEDCDVTTLAERFGTPLYVASEDQLRRNARRFKAAFGERWPGELLLLPSIKANHSIALRRILTEEGTGCDVFGPAELAIALQSGVPPAQISLNGPTKDDALLARGVEAGVRITLDSVDELERTIAAARRTASRATVRFRVRPDYVDLTRASQLAPVPVSIHEAAATYKAGIPTEDLLALDPALLRAPELDVSGLMTHLGRHDTDPATWAGMVDAFVVLLGRLQDAWPGFAPRELDLGGGLPVPRDPFGRAGEADPDATLEPRVPPLEVYAEAMVPRLVAGLEGVGLRPGGMRLELEPGRALYGDAGIHLATVRNVKHETEPLAHTWVETDTSDAWLADAVLERNRWRTMVANRADARVRQVVQVVGTTCALDVIVSDEQLPEVQRGDILAVLDTGAYQDASASNFNALPRPGTILVHGGEAELIRRAERIEEVSARDIVPARLAGGETAGVRPFARPGFVAADALRGRTALVTGAARGIGRGIAEQLRAAGARVVVADIDGAAAAATAQEIGGEPATVDVADEDSVAALLTAALRITGRVDILVNNAGVASTAPLADLTSAEWDRVLGVNTRGTFLCIRALAPQMAEIGGGCIVNISSVSGKHGDPELTHYCASKFAVIGITQSTAMELAPQHIRVNAVCPGTVDTTMMRTMGGEWTVERGVRDQLIKRPVEPHEIGSAVVFLACNEAITGQAINVDGGIVFH